MSKNTYRELSIEELNVKLDECKKVLMNLRFQKAYGQLDKTSNIRDAKKEVARLKTFMHKGSSLHGVSDA